MKILPQKDRMDPDKNFSYLTMPRSDEVEPEVSSRQYFSQTYFQILDKINITICSYNLLSTSKYTLLICLSVCLFVCL